MLASVGPHPPLTSLNTQHNDHNQAPSSSSASCTGRRAPAATTPSSPHPPSRTWVRGGDWRVVYLRELEPITKTRVRLPPIHRPRQHDHNSTHSTLHQYRPHTHTHTPNQTAKFFSFAGPVFFALFGKTICYTSLGIAAQFTGAVPLAGGCRGRGLCTGVDPLGGGWSRVTLFHSRVRTPPHATHIKCTKQRTRSC